MTSVIADAVNAFFQGLVDTVNFLISWMPDSPFREPLETMRSSIGSDMLGYLNYFLPISEFIAVLVVWVAAIAIYYAVSIVLRWLKAIS